LEAERFVDEPNLHSQIQKAMETIQECYASIESKFAATKPTYTIGDAFTVVDPFFISMLSMGRESKTGYGYELSELDSMG
jgi:glutathione S-transferase